MNQTTNEPAIFRYAPKRVMVIAVIVCSGLALVSGYVAVTERSMIAGGVAGACVVIATLLAFSHETHIQRGTPSLVQITKLFWRLPVMTKVFLLTDFRSIHVRRHTESGDIDSHPSRDWQISLERAKGGRLAIANRGQLGAGAVCYDAEEIISLLAQTTGLPIVREED